jgi:hypothetical protein
MRLRLVQATVMRSSIPCRGPLRRVVFSLGCSLRPPRDLAGTPGIFMPRRNNSPTAWDSNICAR